MSVTIREVWVIDAADKDRSCCAIAKIGIGAI